MIFGSNIDLIRYCAISTFIQPTCVNVRHDVTILLHAIRFLPALAGVPDGVFQTLDPRIRMLPLHYLEAACIVHDYWQLLATRPGPIPVELSLTGLHDMVLLFLVNMHIAGLVSMVKRLLALVVFGVLQPNNASLKIRHALHIRLVVFEILQEITGIVILLYFESIVFHLFHVLVGLHFLKLFPLARQLRLSLILQRYEELSFSLLVVKLNLRISIELLRVVLFGGEVSGTIMRLVSRTIIGFVS